MSEKRRSGGVVEENLVLDDRSHMGIKGEVAAASLDVNLTARSGRYAMNVEVYLRSATIVNEVEGVSL